VDIGTHTQLKTHSEWVGQPLASLTWAK